MTALIKAHMATFAPTPCINQRASSHARPARRDGDTLTLLLMGDGWTEHEVSLHGVDIPPEVYRYRDTTYHVSAERADGTWEYTR